MKKTLSILLSMAMLLTGCGTKDMAETSNNVSQETVEKETTAAEMDYSESNKYEKERVLIFKVQFQPT